MAVARAAPIVFLSDEELNNSPSRRDGISAESEKKYRRQTCSFVQDLGQILRLPQLTTATASVFVHRFYCVNSLKYFDRHDIACTAVFLAGKVEETPKKLQEVIFAYHRLRKGENGSPEELTEESASFWHAKDRILKYERVLLQALGFDLSIEHAYTHLLKAVQVIPCREYAKVAWNFLNDSYRTTVCLQFHPRVVAAAALYLSSKIEKGKLPQKHPDPEKEKEANLRNDRRPWWARAFDEDAREGITPVRVELPDLRRCKTQLLDLYESVPNSLRGTGQTEPQKKAAGAQQPGNAPSAAAPPSGQAIAGPASTGPPAQQPARPAPTQDIVQEHREPSAVSFTDAPLGSAGVHAGAPVAPSHSHGAPGGREDDRVEHRHERRFKPY